MNWFTFFIIIGILWVIAKPLGEYIRKSRKESKKWKEKQQQIQREEEYRANCAQNLYENSQTENPEYLPYKKAKALTKNEERIFQELKPIAKKYDLFILSKKRLADIIQVKNLWGKSYYHYFDKIKAKHVDFVLAEKNTLDTLLVIELDDDSHLEIDRIKRDIFVDDALRSAGVPIIHIWDDLNLEEKICNAIGLKIFQET